MKNRYQELIKFVLANASPNIQYRVRKEILKESINTPGMLSLQAQILNLPKVKKPLLVKKRTDFLDLCFTAFILTVLILLSIF